MEKQDLNIFNGPGLIVTILIIALLMFLYPQREFIYTFIIAVTGFGAGHIVNYFYNKRKS